MTTLRDLTAKITLETHGHEHLEHLSEQLEGIHEKVELLAGFELVKGLYELAERFSGVGEKLESASMAAGLTTDKFQALAYAASQNAVSQEELGGALARFSRVLGSAKDGSKEAIAQFAKVGITRDQVMGFADAGDAMMALADQVQGIQDPIKRTQVLMGLLGRGSANMTKLMSVGGAGIRDKMQEAVRINAIGTHKNIENLAEMEDTVSSLGAVFKAVAINMTGYFAPAISHTVERVKEFWLANHAIIEQNFQQWANKAAYALGFVVGVLRATGEELGAFAHRHERLVEDIGKVILAFIGFKAATGVASAGISLMLSPFKEVAAAISTVYQSVMLLKKGWEFFQKARIVMAAFTAATGIGIGGAIAIVAGLVVAIHDAWVLLTGGKVEDTWLYKLIMAIKGLSIGALKKLGLYSPEDDGKAAVMDMQLQPITAGAAPLPRSLDFDGSANPDLQNLTANLGDLSHAQNMPPQSLMMPGQNVEGDSVTYNVDAPITINIPPGADPRAMADAARQGVTTQLNDVLRTTHTNLKQATVR
jgi:hypothetical protein